MSPPCVNNQGVGGVVRIGRRGGEGNRLFSGFFKLYLVFGEFFGFFCGGRGWKIGECKV